MEAEHLGDGAYASFDGYQIWLGANDAQNRSVALEPQVFVALLSYAMRVWSVPHVLAMVNATGKVEGM